MLNGFRQYFETFVPPTPRENGLAELARLEKGHYLIAQPLDYESAYRYMNGSDGLRHVSREMIVTAEDIDRMSRTAKEAVVIMPIPKRWFSRSQLEENGVTGAITPLLTLGQGWHLPPNYVWGYFSKWDEQQEKNTEPGQFYRNQNYHGHDGLYKKWKETTAKGQQKPLVLDRPTPRVAAPFAPQQHRTFHGYNTFDFDSSAQ